MGTAINQHSSPCHFLEPLVVCPGHESIKSVHKSREKAKEVGFKWLKKQQKANNLASCSIDVREDIKNVFALIHSYKHQNIESCPNPHVIFPSDHTACSGHKQIFKTYEAYKDAKKAGFEWLDEKKKDTHYTDCDIDITKDGKNYTLVHLYKHQNLDPSSNPYLRFPCQFLACTGHPHVNSVYSTKKKADKMGSQWCKEKQKDKSSIDYQTEVIDGPKKNYALVYNSKHHHVDTCPSPQPIFPEFFSCPGHSHFFKTYETREKAKQVGTKWLHEKLQDSHYQNCSFNVKDRAKKVHDLVCYFEHQNVEGCSNARTAFDRFVENDHPSLIDKASQFFDENRKTILTAFVIAGSAASATKEISEIGHEARKADDYDFLIRNIADRIKPNPILGVHAKNVSAESLFPSSQSSIVKPDITQQQETNLSSKNDLLLEGDYSFVEDSPLISQLDNSHFQNLVSYSDILGASSLQTLQPANQTEKALDSLHPLQDIKSDTDNKLRTHFYQPLKNNIIYALGHPLFQGTLQAIGGAAEMAIGGALTLGTSGVGFPVGGAIMYHGYDHLMAGLKTAFTRQPSQTMTTNLLQKVGLSHSNAVFADDLMTALLPTGAINWLRAKSFKLLTSPSGLKGAIGNGAGNVNQTVITTAAESVAQKIVFGKEGFTVEKLLESGKAIDRQGLTKAGRALAKHGGREITVFPKPVGNPAHVNAHGQQILQSIINHPNRVISEASHPHFGKVLKVIVPDKWGVWFTIEGEMIGFLEP